MNQSSRVSSTSSRTVVYQNVDASLSLEATRYQNKPRIEFSGQKTTGTTTDDETRTLGSPQAKGIQKKQNLALRPRTAGTKSRTTIEHRSSGQAVSGFTKKNSTPTSFAEESHKRIRAGHTSPKARMGPKLAFILCSNKFQKSFNAEPYVSSSTHSRKSSPKSTKDSMLWRKARVRAFLTNNSTKKKLGVTGRPAEIAPKLNPGFKSQATSPRVKAAEKFYELSSTRDSSMHISGNEDKSSIKSLRRSASSIVEGKVVEMTPEDGDQKSPVIRRGRSTVYYLELLKLRTYVEEYPERVLELVNGFLKRSLSPEEFEILSPEDHDFFVAFVVSNRFPRQQKHSSQKALVCAIIEEMKMDEKDKLFNCSGRNSLQRREKSRRGPTKKGKMAEYLEEYMGKHKKITNLKKEPWSPPTEVARLDKYIQGSLAKRHRAMSQDDLHRANGLLLEHVVLSSIKSNAKSRAERRRLNIRF